MSNFLITYDLDSPGQDYAAIEAAIKDLAGDWMRAGLTTTWFVTTSLSASQIRDRLRNATDNNDEILVVGLNGAWATVGVGDVATAWLKKTL